MLRTTLYKQSYYNKFIFFEDANIQNWAITNFDKDHDQLLTKEDLASVTDAEFNASGLNNVPNIQNFYELKYFTSLRTINIPITVNGDITLPDNTLSMKQINCTTLHIFNTITINRIISKSIHFYENAKFNNNGTFNNYTSKEYITHNSNYYEKINYQLIDKATNSLLTCDVIENVPLIISDKVTNINGMSILASKFNQVIVGDSVQTIRSHFSNMYATIFDIGKNVKVIENYFCYNSLKLQKVIFRGRVTQFTGTTAFAWMNRTKPFTIYVREEDIEYYKGLFKAPYNTYVKSINELTE